MCDAASCTRELAVFGTVYATLLACALLWGIQSQINVVREWPFERQRPALLGLFRMPPLGIGQVRGLALAQTVMLVIAALRVWPAASFFIASILSAVYLSQMAQLPDVRRKGGTVPVILLLLAAGSLPRASTDPRVAGLALFTIQVVVAQVYVSAGLRKIRTAGWRWADGRTLRSWLAHYALRYAPLHVTDLRIPSLAVCRVASILTLTFELSFWIIIVAPGAAGWFLGAAAVFHTATSLTMRINYWILFGPALTVFLAPQLAHWLP